MSLPDDVDKALDGLGFEAYRGRDVAGHDELRRRLFGLLDELLPEPSKRALAEHLERDWTKDRFYNGVSRARADRDTHWEEQLAHFRGRSKDAGAVQLELGVWSRFPDRRRDELRDKDGLAEFIRLDMDGSFPVDVVGDARKLPFRDRSIDRISADSVLEHVPHPHEVLRECFRVLRPGGFLRVGTPFIFNLHGYPDDFLRYTPSWYEQVCREAGFESVVTDSDAARGLYYTLHNSAKAAVVREEAEGAAELRALHLLVMELLGALAPLDDGFHNGARHWFHSVRCLAVRGGALDLSHRERGGDVPFADRCLDLLGEPGTGEALRRAGAWLVCDASRRRFPVRRDGVPDFTSPEDLPSSTRLRGRLKRR